MTAAELHPEDMLDGVREGSLNAVAALDLNAHLDRCAACHLHLQLGEDVAFEGRPERGDRMLSAQLVQAAMAGLDLAAPSPSPAAGSKLRGAWAALALRRLLLPAACVLLGGGAATAMWSARETRIQQRHSAAPASVPSAHPVARVRARPTVQPPAEEVAAADVAAVAPPAAQAEIPYEQPRSVRAPRVSAERLLAPVAISEPAPAAEPAATAAGLFREANQRRRAGDDAGALSRYGELRRQFPGSREEVTARVLAGDLALARGVPAEALREFQSYLDVSPRGTLAEEARVGRARALAALSRTDDERRAWLDLLSRHPSSLHLERARLRLEQLPR